MINVDPYELQKFSKIAYRWWDPTAEFKALHKLNPIRLDWIDAHAYLAGKRVLDIGCGGGILSESMVKLGANVKGIDLSRETLSVAGLHSAESGVIVDYEEITAETLAVREPASYDIVTCMEMLEHVPQPARIVTACATLVKLGGWVFFSTLNRNVKSYFLAVVCAEYIMQMLPKGTHSYAYCIRPSELASFARIAGLHVIQIQGIIYNPIGDHFALSNDISINYLLACRLEV